MESMTGNQKSVMEKYYKFHSVIYDATRWSILFGRKEIFKYLDIPNSTDFKVLEVGVGTGANIVLMKQRFPNISITALDISEIMLEKAKSKLQSYDNISFIADAFSTNAFQATEKFDLILFSYSLSMFAENWSTAIEDANALLKNNGSIAVVDFHNTNTAIMKKIWKNVHVNMDGHLLKKLDVHFQPYKRQIKPAYLGLWEYFLYVGRPQKVF